MSDLISWLRSTIEGDKAAAEAAGAPRQVDARVKDENGIRCVKQSVEYSGEWRFVDGGDAVWPACPDAEAIVSGSCGCCCSVSDGLVADLVHIAIHDPRDVIARCEAELAILDQVLPEVRRVAVRLAEEFGGIWPDSKLTSSERMLLNTLASGYRHRSGFDPAWLEG